MCPRTKEIYLFLQHLIILLNKPTEFYCYRVVFFLIVLGPYKYLFIHKKVISSIFTNLLATKESEIFETLWNNRAFMNEYINERLQFRAICITMIQIIVFMACSLEKAVPN